MNIFLIYHNKPLSRDFESLNELFRKQIINTSDKRVRDLSITELIKF